jgi:hypothetical protein
MFQAAEHARKLRECNGIGLAERIENRAIVIPALRRPHTKVRDSSQSLQTSPALSPHRQTDQWEGSSQSWQTSNNWQAREVLVNRGSEQQSPRQEPSHQDPSWQDSSWQAAACNHNPQWSDAEWHIDHVQASTRSTAVNKTQSMMRREAKQRSNPFNCQAECAIKQLRRAMKESGADQISNAKVKAIAACTKKASHALFQEGVPDPGDKVAQRRALLYVMEVSAHG